MNLSAAIRTRPPEERKPTLLDHLAVSAGRWFPGEAEGAKAKAAFKKPVLLVL
jgi:hypothetical protein